MLNTLASSLANLDWGVGSGEEGFFFSGVKMGLALVSESPNLKINPAAFDSDQEAVS